MRHALVTDGEQRAALATVRSLGRAGWQVVVTSRTGRSLAGASRHAAQDVAVPDPLTDPDGHRAAVAAVVQREGARVVVPVTEPASLTLLADPAALAPAVVASADLPRFQRLADKAEVLGVASELGIAVPSQVVLNAGAAGMALDPRLSTLDYPLVLKPSRSVGTDSSGRRAKLSVRHAASAAELAQRLAELPDAAWPVLLQQRVVGPGVGAFYLRWGGRFVAAFAHRRLREKPPSGGVSTLRESIALDPALDALSRRLLEAFDWQGLAMVEYKVDEATGTPFLMEVNGRPWGSLQLAVDAGVDFPALLAEAATGGTLPSELPAWRNGVELKWEWGEVDHLLARFRRSDAANALPAGTPGRWATLGSVLRPTLRRRHEVCRLSDPMPFLRETLQWFRGGA